MQSQYEKQVYQLLSAYRFLSFALAALFTQVRTPVITRVVSVNQIYIILLVLGIYTMLRVFSPLRWRERSLLAYIILLGDFFLCIALLMITDGVNSIFLLYSITPVLTAAILFEEKIAFSMAAFSSLSLAIIHILFSQFSNRFSSIIQERNLTILIIYGFLSLFIAIVPSRINLNIRRRIESEAIMEERRRIGREIHDSIAQSLSYLNLKISRIKNSISSQKTEQALNSLDEVLNVIQDIYGDIRDYIDQLDTRKKSFPLIASLPEYANKFSEESGIKAQFQLSRAFPRLSPSVELQLFRIVQEALTNVRKHSHASEVLVKLEHNAQTVELMVKDNGKGFAIQEHDKSAPYYHGLEIMRERGEGIGGKVVVSSSPGQGTEVKIMIPTDRVRL